MTRSRVVPGGIAGLCLLPLALLVLGPVLWSRGYVLVGDMAFVPDQPWKPAWLGLDGSVPRAVPADAVVSVLGQVVPGDLLQKAILLGILLFAGWGLLRLTATVDGISDPARLGGAVLYLWNPYVFERFAIGHWGLLVGYAALPWVLTSALAVRRDTASALPGALPGLVLGLAVAAVGSPTGGLLAGMAALVVIAGSDRLRSALAVVAAVVLVNLPWLAPAVLNNAGTSDSAGVAAFAARSDTPWGLPASLLTFGGIWKDSVVPGERETGLLTLAALVAVLCSLGFLVARARRHRAADVLASPRLLVLAGLGLVLAGLPAVGPGERWVTELVETVPGTGLWRDSQKLLMPSVVVTCVGFALLLDAVGRRLRHQGLPWLSVTVLLALVPVALMPSLAWGLSGRLSPAAFPSEWHAVRAVLEQQPESVRRTAVLPWSAYQRLPWNDRRAALDPASRFFPGDVVVSEDLTLGPAGTVRGDGRTSAGIGAALAAGDPLGPALADAQVRYLLVEKTAPSDHDIPLPAGTVLHDGDELLLLDLGNDVRLDRAPHAGLVVAADVLAALGLLGAAAWMIRRKSDP